MSLSLARVLTVGAPALVALCGLFACSSAPPDAGTAGAQGSGTQALGGDTPLGLAPKDGGFRALMVLSLQNESALRGLVDTMYTPGSPTFRQYLSRAEFDATYAPTQASLATVTAWVQSQGMNVDRTASNRMLVQFSGTVAQFESAFGVTLTESMRGSDEIYTTSGPATIPGPLGAIVSTILTPDLPATGGSLQDSGTILTTNPGDASYLATDLAAAYGDGELSVHGTGETIGIVVGGGVRLSDVQSYWQSQQITRKDPVFVVTAESPGSYDEEATLDVQWSGGLAPDAEIRVYQSPDVRDTSLVFAFDEAIGGGQATVVTDSFAHNESVTPVNVRTTYNYAALEAAALGVTVLAASGDSNLVDVPSSDPYVTAVGGTAVTLANGAWKSETSWSSTGCGVSSYFAQPSWQAGKTPGNTTRRAVADIAAEANNLWFFFAGQWQQAGGTSFASPTTAGLIASLNSARLARGEGGAGATRVGWLNPILYNVPAVQAAMHDITTGSSGSFDAGVGWDDVTGWGSLDVGKLVTAIP